MFVSIMTPRGTTPMSRSTKQLRVLMVIENSYKITRKSIKMYLVEYPSSARLLGEDDVLLYKDTEHYRPDMHKRGGYYRWLYEDEVIVHDDGMHNNDFKYLLSEE